MSTGEVEKTASIDGPRIGDRLPDLQVTVDRVQMFAFGAATHNAHRIHYDVTWAREREGYPDLLVHGPLQTALMVRQVTDWAGPNSRLTSVGMTNLAVAHPGQLLTCTAEIVSVSEEPSGCRVELQLMCLRDDTVLVRGNAVVVLDSSATLN